MVGRNPIIRYFLKIYIILHIEVLNQILPTKGIRSIMILSRETDLGITSDAIYQTPQTYLPFFGCQKKRRMLTVFFILHFSIFGRYVYTTPTPT